jgi:hypothetical protein
MSIFSVIAGTCNVEHIVTTGVFLYRDQCTENTSIRKRQQGKVKTILFYLKGYNSEENCGEYNNANLSSFAPT